jgi:DNA-binding MarR family transcriptional regulator
MAKQLGIPKHSGTQRPYDVQNASPHSPATNDSLLDNKSTSGASIEEKSSRAEKPNSDFCFLPEEPLPIGRALARVMRAVIFGDPPSPELDTLPLAQLRLLWVVFYASEATMKDFSERLGVSQSTVTQLADRLVKRGLVERRADPDDRRIVRLRVSPTGGQILMDAKNREHQTLQSVWEALTPSEQTDVVRGLETLAQTAEAIRVAQGRPLLPISDHRDHSHLRPPADANAASQPVVDLMTRRVRGKRM